MKECLCLMLTRYARPGASSLLGLLLENGPLLVTEDGSLRSNNASWSSLVDYVWVDQPVYVISKMAFTT